MDDCPFCDIVRKKTPASIVYEDEHTLAFMDLRPICPGHVLVIPKVHCSTIYDLELETAGRLFQSVTRVARAMAASLEPEGLNVWQSNGSAAGQVVPHVHIHLVPRRSGDQFFLMARPHVPLAERRALDILAGVIQMGLADAEAADDEDAP
ncbi:MAG: HIT family protein [Anaerolineae bacterium]